MTDGPVTSTRESTETLEAMADQLRRDAEPAFPLAETRIGIDVVQGLVEEVLEARRTPGGTNAVEHLLDVARQDRDDVELKLGKAYEELGTARDLVEHYKGIQAELLRQAQVLQGRLNEEFAAAELYQAQRNELSERLSVRQDDRDMQAAARQSETNRANEEHRKAEQWRRLLQAQITEAKALATRMLNAEAAAREAQSRLSAKADEAAAMQRRAEAAEDDIEAEVEAKKALTRRGEAAERKVAELEQSRNFLGRAVQEAHRDRDDLAHQLATTIASLDLARENAKQSDERVAVLDAELNRVRGERDAEEDAHTYERETTARLRHERDQLKAVVASRERQVRQLQVAFSEQEALADQFHDEREDATEAISRLQTELAQKSEMLAETMNELAALQLTRGEDGGIEPARMDRLVNRHNNLRIAIAKALDEDGGA